MTPKPTRRSPLFILTLTGFVATGLMGCRRAAPAPKPSALPPALAPVLVRGLNAGGEQPFWALQIRSKTLTFASQTADAIVMVNTGPAQAPKDGAGGGLGGGVWTGATKTGGFKAVVTPLPCRDAATGLAYPFTADVALARIAYRGCATWPGQGLGPRR
jgi:uncharacterized membrane protein